MVIMYSIIRQTHPELTVIIDRQDNDIYMQAAFVADIKVTGDLLTKHNNGYINWRTLVDEDTRDDIIAMHCLSGCDHVPSLNGHARSRL